MSFLRSRMGLTPEVLSPPCPAERGDIVTEETGIRPPAGGDVAVTPLVKEDDRVGAGDAVACLRTAPDICLAAPVAGRVARISLRPGRRLDEIVIYREPGEGGATHDLAAARSAAGLRRLFQAAGAWPWFGRRPFGGMPAPAEVPAAIFVMASDTRPHAPDPVEEITGREEALARGLTALATLAGGTVFVCWPGNAPTPSLDLGDVDIRWIRCGPRHPQGSAGIRIHQCCPAGLDAAVWDIHAGDVAALGEMLATGVLPMTRAVRIAGPGLAEGRSLTTHVGADLRQLTQRITAPGPHTLVSGSALDGQPARWLGPRDRQITVLPRDTAPTRPHWLIAALTDRAGSRPAIPTAALDQSLGGGVPAAPFIRALGAGNDEAAMSMGLLSLLEEDIALTDYVLGAGGEIAGQLRAMLERIRTEYAA